MVKAFQKTLYFELVKSCPVCETVLLAFISTVMFSGSLSDCMEIKVYLDHFTNFLTSSITCVTDEVRSVHVLSKNILNFKSSMFTIHYHDPSLKHF